MFEDNRVQDGIRPGMSGCCPETEAKRDIVARLIAS